MARIVEGPHEIQNKIGGIHGAGQCQSYMNLSGLWIAPAGMDAKLGSTLANSEGIAGAPVGVCGAPIITLNRQVGPVANGTTVLTTLFTYTLPAKTLTRTGQSVRIRCLGVTAANGNNKTITCVFGGTTFTFISAAAIQGSVWVMDVTVTRTGALTQQATAILYIGGAAISALPTGVTSNIVGLNSALTETDTGDIVISVKAQSGTASSDITGNDFKVDLEQF